MFFFIKLQVFETDFHRRVETPFKMYAKPISLPEVIDSLPAIYPDM